MPNAATSTNPERSSAELPRPHGGGGASGLRVGGFTPLTTLDFPDRLSAVVFCQGCPWRCGYCHNPHLLPRRGQGEIPWGQVEGFLERRRGLLDAVVFSGGEPTLQRDLAAAVRRVRTLGFEAVLHTAGAFPERLGRLLPTLAWVALDVKAPLSHYGALTGAPGSGEAVRRSLEMLVEWGGAFEVRTTAHPNLTGDTSLLEIGHTLADLGVRHYVVQRFRPEGCDDGDLRATADPRFPGAQLRDRLASLIPEFVLR